MAEAYKQFLASSSPSLLAENATLHYITTTTAITGAAEIAKHLTALQKQMTKKKQDVLNLIEGHNGLAVEVNTAIEFLTSGGPYLPGLDDNFLTDRTAYFPVVSRIFVPGLFLVNWVTTTLQLTDSGTLDAPRNF